MAGPHSRPHSATGPPADGPTLTLPTDLPSTVDEAARPKVSDVPPVIPRYAVGRRVGFGGMGVVYEAVAPIGVTVALKVIHPDLLSPSLRLRFRQEARAMMAVDHPHLARIYDYGEADAGPYFTMRLLSGRTLATLLPAFARDPVAGLRKLLKAVDAVAYLHARRLIHRDLKPSNILLDDFDEPFVSDLGLVKELAADPDHPADGLSPTGATPGGGASPTLTQLGKAIGTRAYMAPEQRAGDHRRVGTPADVYALGLIAGEIAWGFRPVVDEHGALVIPGEGTAGSLPTGVKVLLREILPESDPPPPAAPPAPLSALPAPVAAGLRRVIARCLAPDPADRYPTAGEFATALAAALDPPAAPVHEPTPTRRWVLAAGGVGLLGLGTWAAMGLWRKKDPLEKLQQAFADADEIDLLGADGTWQWSDFHGGDGEWHVGPPPDGPADARGWFDVPTGEVRLLEVARGLTGFGFRLVVEVRGPGLKIEVGAYAGRSFHPLPGGPLHALVAVGEREIEGSRAHWQFNGRTLYADRPGRFVNAQTLHQEAVPLPDPGGWRKIELTLTTDAVAAVAAGRPFGGWTRSKLLDTGRKLGFARPEAAALTPTFHPAEGLGLFGSGGPVAVRSARLFRIPDPAHP